MSDVIGEHAGLYVENAGHPILFDPGGDYIPPQERTHPSDDYMENEEAALYPYVTSSLHAGQGIETLCFNTTAQEEAEIAKRIKNHGAAFPGRCAATTSNILHGIGPFNKLGQYYFPASLARQLRKLKAQGTGK